MLAQIVTDIRQHSSEPSTILHACAYGNGMSHIASKDISKILKYIAKTMDLQQLGFPFSRTCTYSLLVGGTMALKLASLEIVMIKNTSDSYYTHS